tara:strand:+ start:201 stop:1361 length:1161 start_codon:yes stop_codon:yes gene_type:complete
MIYDVIYEHLENIRQTKVRTIQSTATIIDPKHTVSRTIDKIVKNDSYDAFFKRGKTVYGTNVRELLSARDVTSMKVEPFLHPIPSVSPNDNLEKVAKIISHYRTRSVPVVEKDKISGVIKAENILKILSKLDNKWIKASLIFTPTPITIDHNSSLSSAKKIMTSKRIDHLPVTSNGQVKQVLTSYHVLQALIPEERLGKNSMAAKRITKFGSRVKNIGTNKISQCVPRDNISMVIKSMLENKTSFCLVTLWDNIHGIITYRDILDLFETKVESDIPIYIIGMPDDERNSDMIESKFKKTLQRLNKVSSEIQEARVSIKRQRVRGTKQLYQITVLIITPHKTLSFKEQEWDLSKSMENINQKILKSLSKKDRKRSKISIRKSRGRLF